MKGTTSASFSTCGLCCRRCRGHRHRRQAAAQTPEEFYKGKSIDLVIGYPPGGSNDTWGRILARHLGKHVPGKPNIVPKNMPGAGSFLA